MKTPFKIFAVCATFVCASALLLLSAAADAAPILNGSFETPTVPVGGFTSFASGSNAITDWTVVGPSGSSVAIVSGTFTQFGFTFPAQDSVQWLDLTGIGSNTTAGVQQTVATTPGALYDLSCQRGRPGCIGFTTGAILEIDARAPAPLGFTLLGTNVVVYKVGKSTRQLNVNVYRKN
jgi:hypothetical protein